MPPILGGLATIEVESESYGGRTARMIRLLVVWGERALALAVVAAVLAFAVGTSREIVRSDWGNADSINRSIGSALVVGIGFELARLPVTHELVAVLGRVRDITELEHLAPEPRVASLQGMNGRVECGYW